jgi:hypothetical protein
MLLFIINYIIVQQMGCKKKHLSLSAKTRNHVYKQVPCRTAMKGCFPLNGTYFQVNEVKRRFPTFLHLFCGWRKDRLIDQVEEQHYQLILCCGLLLRQVFADHASSLQPIEVPRRLLWSLQRRFVYFGTAVTNIFKGMSPTVPLDPTVSFSLINDR